MTETTQRLVLFLVVVVGAVTIGAFAADHPLLGGVGLALTATVVGFARN